MTGVGFPFLCSHRTGIGARRGAWSISNLGLFEDSIQTASIHKRLHASIMLYPAVPSDDIFCLQLNPCQEALVAFTVTLAKGKSGKGTTTFDIGVSPSAISPNPKFTKSGSIPHAKYSSIASRPPIELVARTKAISPASSSGQLKEGSIT
jgi:hypothetical protein